MPTEPDYDLDRDFKDCCAIAESLGLVCVVPKPNELFIDLDSEESLDRFKSLAQMLHRLVEPGAYHRVAPSKSPGHYHAVVTLAQPVESEEQRLMLQAILGSDPKRELMGLARLRAGADDDAITVFFEPKPTAPTEPVTLTQEPA